MRAERGLLGASDGEIVRAPRSVAERGALGFPVVEVWVSPLVVVSVCPDGTK